MKKFTKLLSALTALTISATAFAGLAVPASAAQLYSQNYESETVSTITEKTVEDKTTHEVSNLASGWTVAQADRYMAIISEADSNKYFELTSHPDSNGGNGYNGTTATFSGISVAAGTNFTMTFDLSVTPGNNQGGTAFEIKSAGSSDGNILTLQQTAAQARTMHVNGDTSLVVDYTGAPWYSYVVSKKDNLTYLTVKDSEGNDIISKRAINNLSANGGISQLKISTGRYSTDFKLDNIVVRDLEDGDVPDISLYEVTINTNPFATVKYTVNDGEEQTKYTGADGVLLLNNLEKDTVIKYTVSKSGYTSSASKTVTVVDADITENTVLDLDSEHSNYLYFETDWTNGTGNWTNGASNRSATTALAPDGFAFPKSGDDYETFKIHVNTSIGKLSEDDNKGNPENPVVNWVLDSDKGIFLGLHWEKNNTGSETGTTGFFAFTGWTGTTTNPLMNSSDIASCMVNSVKISDEPIIDATDLYFTVDMANSAITVQKDDEILGALPITESTQDSTKFTAMRIGQYRYYNDVHINELAIDKPDPNTVLVNGTDLEFAKITGKTVTQTFTASPVLPVADEGFIWTVTNTDDTAVGAGISIDENGVLSVTGDATPGTVKVTATSDKSATKKGSINVIIHDDATLTPTVEGPKTVQIGESAEYKVTKIVDQYGDDVTEYFTPTFSINGKTSDTAVEFEDLAEGKAVALSATYKSGALERVSSEEITIPEGGTLSYNAPAGAKVMIWKSVAGVEPVATEVKTAPAAAVDADAVAAIGGKTGVLDTYKAGTATITITMADGKTSTYEVKVDNFSKEVDYTTAAIDITDLVDDDAITGYQVTIADADKNLLVQEIVTGDKDTASITPQTVTEDNPAKIEIAPVYETTIGTELAVPADTYNITITANNASRADVYVNNQMVVNNLNQGSDVTWSSVKGAYPETATYTYKDIVVKEGSAVFKYDDDQGAPVTSIAMVKSPSIVNRTRKVYIIGDSLVANYYDRVNAADEKVCRTGWGQVMDNYLKNVDVINLGNSGAWAVGMYNDAFTQVKASSKPGDIVLWESGYNDRNNPKALTEAQRSVLMIETMTKVVNECNALDVDIYLITPNASAHDLKPSPNFGGRMRTVSEATGAPLIDLGQMSFDFLNEHYGPFPFDGTYYSFPNDAMKNTEIKYFHNANDTLHSTQNAANVWASLVAGGLYDAGETDIVNTEYTYTFTDDKATPETFTIKVTPSSK